MSIRIGFVFTSPMAVEVHYHMMGALELASTTKVGHHLEGACNLGLQLVNYQRIDMLVAGSTEVDLAYSLQVTHSPFAAGVEFMAGCTTTAEVLDTAVVVAAVVGYTVVKQIATRATHFVEIPSEVIRHKSSMDHQGLRERINF